MAIGGPVCGEIGSLTKRLYVVLPSLSVLSWQGLCGIGTLTTDIQSMSPSGQEVEAKKGGGLTIAVHPAESAHLAVGGPSKMEYSHPQM